MRLSRALPFPDATELAFVRGGLLGASLSCVFCALLAVGRIMRAKKPSLGGLRTSLTRDLALVAPLSWVGREARGARFVVGFGGAILTGGRLVTVELRPRTGLLVFLAIEAAVGATREVDTREDGPLVSAGSGASVFAVFGGPGGLMDETRRLAGGVCVRDKTSTVDLPFTGDGMTFLGDSSRLSGSATGSGLGGEALAPAFSWFGTTDGFGILGEVEGLSDCAGGGSRRVGGGLMIFASFVVFSFTDGGGRVRSDASASLSLPTIGLEFVSLCAFPPVTVGIDFFTAAAALGPLVSVSFAFN